MPKHVWTFLSSHSQAPEVLAGARYNTSADVYSYAMTIFECACGGKHAYICSLFRESDSSAWRPNPTEELVQKHPLVWALIQECWRSEKTEEAKGEALASAADIARRPTFTEIVERLEAMRSTHNEKPQASPAFSTDEFKAARARHHDSPKGFACFLSHHKQACAAEARLVKQQLESMLDAKVFLGKCCALGSPPPS